MEKFVFKKYPVFTDGEIDVAVEIEFPAKHNKGVDWPPTYYFKVMQHDNPEKIGRISLSLGYGDFLVRYNGQVGFAIRESCRGHHYAAKACVLIRQVAVDHHMDAIWIGCDPENMASRRTCELIGATLVEIVEVPTGCFLYEEGHRQVCRYRWVIY